MNKFVTIKEFGTLISEKANYKNEQFTSIPDDAFTALKQFIHDYESSDDSSDVLEFMKIGYDRYALDTIRFNNYVGLIQLKNGFQIEILPKISFFNEQIDEAKSITKTKSIFIKMLRTLKDFPSKVFTTANLNIDKMHLYEIFINMYIQEVRHLIKLGLKSSYTNEEDNLNYYKGKLMINEHLKRNAAHRERFYVSYGEFNQNRPENKIIKSTLLKLQNISNDYNNTSAISKLLNFFEMIDESYNYDKDFSSITITRGNKEYQNVISWSKVFLKNKSFTTFSGSNNSRALLFPMEKIFESYIAHELKKACEDTSWHLTAQASGYYLFDSPQKFKLRPDIVIETDNSTVILDTKWKNLVDNEYKNYGISQSDMYQMYAYSKKYVNAPVIWLLYPLNEEMNKYKDSGISFKSDDNVTVNVFFVDLDDIERSLTNLKNKINEED